MAVTSLLLGSSEPTPPHLRGLAGPADAISLQLSICLRALRQRKSRPFGRLAERRRNDPVRSSHSLSYEPPRCCPCLKWTSLSADGRGAMPQPHHRDEVPGNPIWLGVCVKTSLSFSHFGSGVPTKKPQLPRRGGYGRSRLSRISHVRVNPFFGEISENWSLMYRRGP